jgi:hypothetical protein
MKVKRKITVEKEIEFELTKPRFIQLHNCIYIGFFPGEPIRVTRILVDIHENSLEVNEREMLDIELNYLADVGNNKFVEITEAEFTNKVNSELLKHNFITEEIIQTTS